MARDVREQGTEVARQYAALELIAAELADEQPATAMLVREHMRELITKGGLHMRTERALVRAVVDENDPRKFVS